MFDVRLVGFEPDGSDTASYLLPWEVLQHETASIVRTEQELAAYQAAVPDDFDPHVAARELAALPDIERVAG